MIGQGVHRDAGVKDPPTVSQRRGLPLLGGLQVKLCWVSGEQNVGRETGWRVHWTHADVECGSRSDRQTDRHIIACGFAVLLEVGVE